MCYLQEQLSIVMLGMCIACCILIMCHCYKFSENVLAEKCLSFPEFLVGFWVWIEMEVVGGRG